MFRCSRYAACSRRIQGTLGFKTVVWSLKGQSGSFRFSLYIFKIIRHPRIWCVETMKIHQNTTIFWSMAHIYRPLHQTVDVLQQRPISMASDQPASRKSWPSSGSWLVRQASNQLTYEATSWRSEGCWRISMDFLFFLQLDDAWNIWTLLKIERSWLISSKLARASNSISVNWTQKTRTQSDIKDHDGR